MLDDKFWKQMFHALDNMTDEEFKKHLDEFDKEHEGIPKDEEPVIVYPSDEELAYIKAKHDAELEREEADNWFRKALENSRDTYGFIMLLCKRISDASKKDPSVEYRLNKEEWYHRVLFAMGIEKHVYVNIDLDYGGGTAAGDFVNTWNKQKKGYYAEIAEGMNVHDFYGQKVVDVYIFYSPNTYSYNMLGLLMNTVYRFFENYRIPIPSDDMNMTILEELKVRNLPK